VVGIAARLKWAVIMHVENQSSDFLVQCYHVVRATTWQRCCCRQCGVHCSPFASICHVCGAQDPVRFPFVWLGYAVALITGVTILGIWVT